MLTPRKHHRVAGHKRSFNKEVDVYDVAFYAFREHILKLDLFLRSSTNEYVMLCFYNTKMQIIKFSFSFFLKKNHFIKNFNIGALKWQLTRFDLGVTEIFETNLDPESFKYAVKNSRDRTYNDHRAENSINYLDDPRSEAMNSFAFFVEEVNIKGRAKSTGITQWA